MTNKSNSKYSYIFEQVSSPQKVEVLSEGVSEGTGEPKVIFKAKLQTAGEKNQNGRIYSQRVCESITKQLKDKAQSRSLLMEVDHPMVVTKDPKLMQRRATTVEYKSCGALLRNIYMEGTDIIGEIETLSGFHGPDVAKMVLYDKVNIGFSLRALGSVNTQPDGTVEVLTPIKPITYDIVSNPSHSKARVLEFLPESYAGSYDDGALICESSDADVLLLQQDGINIFNEPLERSFIESIIQSDFSKALKDIKFRF